jgi:hypothetical protein
MFLANLDHDRRFKEQVATLVAMPFPSTTHPPKTKQRRIENDEQIQRKDKRTMSSMTGHALGSVHDRF